MLKDHSDSLYDHLKNGHKIRSGHMVIQPTTTVTYNQNSGPGYKLRTTCISTFQFLKKDKQGRLFPYFLLGSTDISLVNTGSPS